MLFSWCNMEDSFVGFMFDGWVRTVVTETDNTMLTMQTLSPVIMFNVVIIMVIVPLGSIVFAIVVGTLHQIESFIPRRFTFLVAIERCVSYVSFSFIPTAVTSALCYQ